MEMLAVSGAEELVLHVLTHVLVATDGAARAVARRQYYASTGYNGEQTVAGFLPVQGGTVVVSSSHALTDQVTGFGGFAKRSIGSRVMAARMQEIFEADRRKGRPIGSRPDAVSAPGCARSVDHSPARGRPSVVTGSTGKPLRCHDSRPPLRECRLR
jgi:hypothetical protein